VTSQVDQANGPSHIIGYAFDGFPVYGDRDINGQPIKPETLDECNGIESPTPEFPGGIYHYVLLEVATVQSTIRCLHGKISPPLPGSEPSGPPPPGAGALAPRLRPSGAGDRGRPLRHR
jgi:hypothetical protein